MSKFKSLAISRKSFATEIGVSAATLCRYLNGERIPSREVMEKIYTKTKGQISPNDFYNLKISSNKKKKKVTRNQV